MNIPTLIKCQATGLAVLFTLAACGGGQDRANLGENNSTPLQPTEISNETVFACASGVSEAFMSCTRDVLEKTKTCLDSTNSICQRDVFESNFNDLDTMITSSCGSNEVVQKAGFGVSQSLMGLTAQLSNQCLFQAEHIAARTLGGPNASLWKQTSGVQSDRNCLSTAFQEAETLLQASLAAKHECQLRGNCSALSELSTKASDSANRIRNVCGVTRFEQLNGSPEKLFIERTLKRSDCAASFSLGEVDKLKLNCGPNDIRLKGVEVFDESGNEIEQHPSSLQPGNNYQVVFDSEVWGTRCGDGSDFAAWLRWGSKGPALSPVLAHIEGDGACFLGTCANTPSSKFSALQDNPSENMGGYMRPSPINPFSDHSVLYVPYCTQDLNIGGGTLDPGPGPQGQPIYRYGGSNLRAALDLLYDLLWSAQKLEAKEGFRPEETDIIFAGTSSGAYGVQYNLHYFLDELGFKKSRFSTHAAVVNGGGIAPNFDYLFDLLEPTLKHRAFLPPYCTDAECAKTEIILPKHLERLSVAEGQKILVSSAQNDPVQQKTQGFVFPPIGPEIIDNRAQWTNRLREMYCDIRESGGLSFFLPANSGEGVHGFVNKDEFIDGTDASSKNVVFQGKRVFDWLSDILISKQEPYSLVNEGLLVQEQSGVHPFPCSVEK